MPHIERAIRMTLMMKNQRVFMMRRKNEPVKAPMVRKMK